VKAGHNQEMLVLLPFLLMSCLICTNQVYLGGLDSKKCTFFMWIEDYIEKL
jgi:hypothetical protein